jgi:hypothetical protein
MSPPTDTKSKGKGQKRKVVAEKKPVETVSFVWIALSGFPLLTFCALGCALVLGSASSSEEGGGREGSRQQQQEEQKK